MKLCKSDIKTVNGKSKLHPKSTFFHYLFCAAEYASKTWTVSDFFCIMQYSAICSLKYLYRTWVVIIMYHRKPVLLYIWYLSCTKHSAQNCCFNIYVAISSISSLFWNHWEDQLKWMSEEFFFTSSLGGCSLEKNPITKKVRKNTVQTMIIPW